jgi:NAD-dependent dihydropyrimidine dehydrogenase PreA subunit
MPKPQLKKKRPAKKKQTAFSNVYTVGPISFDLENCKGCNSCVEACISDVFLPSRHKGKVPQIAFPGDCWYCGSCVVACRQDAIRLNGLLQNRVHFRPSVGPPSSAE